MKREKAAKSRSSDHREKVMVVSPFDICRHCGAIQNLHYPGTVACDHFEKAEPSHTVREILHPPMVRCPNCGSGNQRDNEHPASKCWNCHEPIPLVEKAFYSIPEPNVPVGNHSTKPYSAPKLEKLSLEERLLEHAANWHMVKARLRLTQEKLAKCFDQESKDSELESFYEFCVTLLKG